MVIDDQWELAITDPSIARAFKVDSRHQKFSIILVTQSIFDQGKWGKTIRLNTEIFILFRNYGDSKTNNRLTNQMGLKERYVDCMSFIAKEKHAYCIINNSPHVDNEELRVQTNIFGEFTKILPFPILFT